MSGYNELLKLTQKLFTGRTLCGLPIQMQNNCQLAKFKHAQKAKYRDFRVVDR